MLRAWLLPCGRVTSERRDRHVYCTVIVIYEMYPISRFESRRRTRESAGAVACGCAVRSGGVRVVLL